ncbi:MAG: hypothetical protein BWY82_02471 [Verrucomicrobia bacterium ADurb.Bin474]|nr:MAG: hypothetical protein BWY82_02471 [Verrucomicrobia bacterium ADurb.Bin474]
MLGQSGCQHSARAGFRHRNRLLIRDQILVDPLREGAFSITDQILAKKLCDIRCQLVECRLTGRIETRQAEIDDHGRMCAIRHFHPRMHIQQRLDLGLQHRLSDPTGPQLNEWILSGHQAFRQQLGHKNLRHHRLKLAGRPRKHHQIPPILLKEKARSGPIRVLEDLSAFQHPALPEVVFRHLPSKALKPCLDRCPDALVELKR